MPDPTSETRRSRQADHVARLRPRLEGLQGRGVLVAVLDTGWDRSSDNRQVLPGAGFDGPGACSADDDDRLGHGTACTNLILGIAPGASVLPVRVFGSQLQTTPETLSHGIVWAADRGARVLNLSLGTVDPECIPPIAEACEYARDRGAIIVSARSSRNVWSVPASLESTIGVAPGWFDHPWTFTYRHRQPIECRAKAQHEGVRWAGGTTVDVCSSSFAAPCITGMVALLLERTPSSNLEALKTSLAGLSFAEIPSPQTGRTLRDDVGPSTARADATSTRAP